MSAAPRPPRRRLLTAVGPGLLVAATGVGAGDLATAAFTGSALGVAVLWAVVLGAAVKFLLNEGLARYQLVRGETFLEGVAGRAPRLLRLAFLAYFLLWSFLVGAALLSAAGAAAHAIVPLFADATTDKIVFGALHSVAALVLVRLGGYGLFEKAMAASVAVMAATVVVSAALLAPSWAAVLRGLVVPAIPDAGGEGLAWALALLGGVGGTVTILAYGYWIREEGRGGPGDLALCRVDLAVGYAVTALFGVAMVILGSGVHVAGGGVALLVALGAELETHLGTAWRLLFLAGAWAAVFSSVLGVWQSAPYLFADLLRAGLPRDRRPPSIDVAGRPYRLYLWAIATLPCLGLWVGFARMQRLYAWTGAAFLPLLAAALLVTNRRPDLLGRHRDRPWTTALLAAVTLLFVALFALDLLGG